MPTEAKFGLVLGITLTIAVAIFFRPKEMPSPLSNHALATAPESAKELQGQMTSNRK